VRRTVSLWRGIPLLIVIIAAAIAGMAWAVSSPIGSSPDEDFHLASIWCPPPVETSGCKVQTDAQGVTSVTLIARVVAAPACYAFHPDTSGSCIWAVPADKLVSDSRFDRGEYPGGFYRVMHIFASNDPYASVYAIRAFNLALAICLGAALVLAATRPTRRIIAYAVASTYVPMGMFIIPSANPSSWAVMGLTATAFALHSYWLATTRPRLIANGVLAAVGVIMAVSARGDAALYVVLTAVAITVLHYRRVRGHALRAILPAVLAVVGGVVARTSSQTTSALSTGLGTGTAGGWRLLFSNLVNLPYVVLGNQGLGNLGWLDTPLPSLVSVGMIMVTSFLLMAGLSRLSWVKALVAGGGVLVLMALPLFILQVSHYFVGQGMQPRYLLPLLPVISLVVLTGYRPDQAVRLSPLFAWFSWGLVSAANSVALMVNIRRYTTGMDGPTWPGQLVEWWTPGAPGPMVTWIVGSLAFAVAAWMVVRLSSGPDPVAITAELDQRSIEPTSATASGEVVAAEPTTGDDTAAEDVRSATPTEPTGIRPH